MGKAKRSFILPVPLIFITLMSFFPVGVRGLTINPSSFLGMWVLESEHQAVLDGIQKVKDLQLGNLVVIPTEHENRRYLCGLDFPLTDFDTSFYRATTILRSYLHLDQMKYLNVTKCSIP